MRRDPIRLLNRGGTGYTSDPARALRSGPDLEPEAVPADVQARFSDASHRNAAQAREVQRVTRREVNGIGRRLAIAKAQAKTNGTDIHQACRLMRLAIIDQRSERAIEKRMQAIEARVFPPLNDLQR